MKLARPALLASLAIAFAVAASAHGADKGKAEAKLNQGIKAADQKLVQEACDELIECGSDAVKVILNVIPKLDGQIYWQCVGGSSGFKDKPALEIVGKFILDNQGNAAKAALSKDLVFGLQNNTSPYVTAPLAMVLEKGKYELQLMCVDQLSQIRSVDSLDALIAAYKREAKGDAELKRRIEQSLTLITGENFGEPGNWEGWWKDQRGKGVPEKKKADGAGGGSQERKPRDQDLGGTMERAQPGRVIVLAAIGEAAGDEKAESNDFDYDHMEEVLKTLKLPHTLVKRKSFAQDPQKYLKDCYALLINCHQINKMCVCPGCQGGDQKNLQNRLGRCNPSCSKHVEVTYALPKDALDAIKNWVETKGGYLYTEDWGLVETLQKLWPDKVGCGAEGKPRLVRKAKDPGPGFEQHITCKLNPSRGATGHPLMRGVWQKPRKDEPKADPAAEPGKTVSKVDSPAKPIEHQWQVDDESPAIEIKDKQNVTPLLESEDLGKFTEGNMAVAITFRVGAAPGRPKQATGGEASKDKGSGEWSLNSKGGRVLHTMSHFGHQSGSEDGQALYNLMVNFLLEASRRHEGENAPPKK